ncbi:MAG: amidase [Paracoccaceae bacterium]
MDKKLELIEKYESLVKAFVPTTFSKQVLKDNFEISQELNKDHYPLAGMFLGIKDIINIDGYPTACGSSLPTDLFSGPQASSVTKLLNAGTVLVGKTVTTEFAISDPGLTRNPRNLAHTPGGSSSGSAAAVAAGFCDIAIGTQTSGSVIRPAGFCGVVGYKPTFNRIPTDGIIPFSKSMDHLGVFASEIDILEETIKVITKDWFQECFHKKGGFKIAVPTGSYMELADSEIKSQFFDFLKKINSSIYTVENFHLVDDISAYNDELDELIHAELYDVHANWFKQYRNYYQPLSRKSIEAGKKVKIERLDQLRSKAHAYSSWLNKFMRDSDIDFWLAPTAPTVAPRGLEYTGDFKMASIWTYTGLPVICLPTGVNQDNLPYSIQLIGRYGEDELLLNHAKNMEAIIGKLELKNFWEL